MKLDFQISWLIHSLFFALTIFSSCQQPNDSRVDASAPESSVNVRFEYHPFTSEDGRPFYLSINTDGHATVTYFNPQLIVVVERREGRLPDALLTDLVSRILDMAVIDDQAEKDDDDTIVEGDVYMLAVVKDGEPRTIGSGIVQAAGERVQEILERLEAIPLQLELRPVDEAYLRAIRIEPKRLALLRARGQLQFHDLLELDGESARVLREALCDPHEFRSLSAADATSLKTVFGDAWTMYILDDRDQGYECTVFRTLGKEGKGKGC